MGGQGVLMDQSPQEPPPWGTPDDSEGYGTPPSPGPGSPPGHGTPPSPDMPPGHGTPPNREAPTNLGIPPGHGTPEHYVTPPSYGTPPGPDRQTRATRRTGRDPLSVDTVVVVERHGFITSGGYDLTTVDDVPIGSLFRETTATGWILGGAASSTSRLLDADGSLVGSLVRPGSLGGRSRFVVSDAHDVEVGTIEQENAFFAPRFLLTTVEGLVMRLTGGQLGSRQWQLVDGLDESVLMGQVSQEYNGLSGMLGDTQRFAVQLSPQLVGGHRLLALMATISLDYVRDAKRRRN
jgi:hypothetical protein